MADERDHESTVSEERMVADRGSRIVEHASLSMRLVTLKAQLPEVEKTARKTPRRDMPEECAKVEVAKALIEPLSEEIEGLERTVQKMHDEIAQLGGYGPRPGFRQALEELGFARADRCQSCGGFIVNGKCDQCGRRVVGSIGPDDDAADVIDIVNDVLRPHGVKIATDILETRDRFLIRVVATR